MSRVTDRDLVGLVMLGMLASVPNAVFAQQPQRAPSPTTAVMATLTVSADVDRAKLTQVMPDEIRATVRLYLDGKIQQWYSRSDGRGVMFILNCSSAAEAKKLTDDLPLSKAGLATFELTELSPLTPLRLLLAPPAAKP